MGTITTPLLRSTGTRLIEHVIERNENNRTKQHRTSAEKAPQVTRQDGTYIYARSGGDFPALDRFVTVFLRVSLLSERWCALQQSLELRTVIGALSRTASCGLTKPSSFLRFASRIRMPSNFGHIRAMNLRENVGRRQASRYRVSKQYV